jgi:magnesium transporter
LNFPKYDQKEKKYIVNPFFFIIWKNYILSFSKYKSHNIDNLEEIAEKNLLDEEEDDTWFDVLYEMLNAMYEKTIKWLRKASNSILYLQEKILNLSKIDSNYLHDITIKKLNMIALRHIFVPQREILEELNKYLAKLHWKSVHEQEEYQLYIDDLDAKLDKIILTTEKLYDTLTSIWESYDSYLAKKSNVRLNLLTIFTAILWVLTLISGIYWMNVKLPLQNYDNTFLLLMILMLITSIIMYYLLKKLIVN